MSSFVMTFVVFPLLRAQSVDVGILFTKAFYSAEVLVHILSIYFHISHQTVSYLFVVGKIDEVVGGCVSASLFLLIQRARQSLTFLWWEMNDIVMVFGGCVSVSTAQLKIIPVAGPFHFHTFVFLSHTPHRVSSPLR